MTPISASPMMRVGGGNFAGTPVLMEGLQVLEGSVNGRPASGLSR